MVLRCARCALELGPTIARCPTCGAATHQPCRPTTSPCPACGSTDPAVIAIPGRPSAGVHLAEVLPVFAFMAAPFAVAVFVAAQPRLAALPWYHPGLAAVGGLALALALIGLVVVARRRGQAYAGWIELHPDRVHVHKPSVHPAFAATSLTAYRLDPAQRVVRLEVDGAWTPARLAIATADEDGLTALLGWLDAHGVPRA